MKKHFFSKIFLLLSLSVFVGCDKDDDTLVDNTPPTIRDYSINDATENVIVAPGSTMHFDAIFEDNVELKEFKIDIHPNFDGHSHGRIKSVDFEFERVYELSGRTATEHKDIPVPADATPGDYHFTVRFLDVAGNEGEIISLDFEIMNPESQPVINVTSPNLNEEIEVAPGEGFQLVGNVEDPDGLAEVHIMVVHEDEHGHDHGRSKEEEPLYEMEYELNGLTSWNFSESELVTIPADVEPGHYELIIVAVDVLGNKTEVTAELHVE